MSCRHCERVLVHPDARRSPLGMANFCCRFIRNYATITKPLRELIKKDPPFLWTKRQNEAFEELRVALNAPKNAYFDSTKKMEIITDASPVGIAAVLTQIHDGNRQVIAYGSRSLSASEQN